MSEKQDKEVEGTKPVRLYSSDLKLMKRLLPIFNAKNPKDLIHMWVLNYFFVNFGRDIINE